MGFQTLERIRSWSPSRLGDYESCPRKAYFKHVKRVPDPGNMYSNRGIELHKKAEEYVTGKLEEIPPELQKVAGYLRYFRQRHALGAVSTELRLAFDKEWKPCGWTEYRAWLRIVIDVMDGISEELYEISDWKSGQLKKNNQAYSDQLNLYSTCILSMGWVTSVSSRLIFIDHGVEVTKPEGLVQLQNLRKSQRTWENRVEHMLEDDVFATNPGWGCKWCPYEKRKGGPCEF